MEKAQLKKFVRIRNKARLGTNLQFAVDLGDAGLTAKDLGEAVAREGGGFEWQTPFGLLIEHPGGQMELEETKA